MVSSWSGQPEIKGRTEWVRMMLLCAVHFGITFTWGVEMTYCTPYLLNLGLTKSQTSLVWIAGPLSGLITQPIVGALADSTRSRWGRRRPYIVVGSIIVAGGLITLGWTRQLVSLVMPTDTDLAKMLIIFVAVSALYVTDFAINAALTFLSSFVAVMSCSRSLLVDTLPIAKQQTGAAWAGRMGSLGHIVGYGMGAVDLPGTLGTSLGATQFQQLTLIAALGILFTSFVTCWAVTERVLISPARRDHLHPHGSGGDGGGRFKVLRQIWSTFLDLPPRIQGICWAVFWGWIGWFPFNVYGSTWVGETYFRYDAAADANKMSSDALGDMGRIGSYTLTIYSFMTFTGAWLLPLFVRAPEDERFTRRPPQSIAHLVEGFSKHKPDLLSIWVAGHVLFASAMFFAPFATSFRFATALVVFCGIPWSIVSWAPVAMMGIEVNKISSDPASYRRLSDAPDAIELSGGIANTTTTTSTTSPPSRADHHHNHLLFVEHGPDDSPHSIASGTTGELSGIYFGILNIYQTIPQFIGTFISTVVFAVLEPGKSPELAADADPAELHSAEGPNAIAVCLFIGAGAAGVAAVVTRRLKYI
ncbi:MFS general substrate transporter [Cryphonectria parasitica EP155]|uniref:MFS general substrate transporter n=1 Tax=Cryphonectria parasitica (strain ATCC 38755 / EP155) TaxID=660469 RepID=A0A9P4Y0V8_CRYP1|nr:MFS general substrate transporter [Cryphonectria parasitica EP155]KAF3764932.1 MFS general substrate transporter [Cryphonectria parasitica EP155]